MVAAERLHGDDTTVPILAKGRTITGRIWTYVRDDRPFGGPDPPAALFYASRDRSGQHPQHYLSGFGGILQADAYGGYNALYVSDRAAGAVTPAFCWAHARRGFFELADIARIFCNKADKVGDAWDEALAAERPVILEFFTDPNVPPLPPHITLKDARNFMTMIPSEPELDSVLKNSAKELVSTILPGR